MIARQQPMTSDFGYRSTARDVLAGHDLAGRAPSSRAATPPLGLETVKALSAAGVSVVVPPVGPDVAAAAVADLPG